MLTTENGSFIIPNGVIVLEDEDIDSYLEETLVFNSYNEELLYNETSMPLYLKRKETIFLDGNE